MQLHRLCARCCEERTKINLELEESHSTKSCKLEDLHLDTKGERKFHGTSESSWSSAFYHNEKGRMHLSDLKVEVEKWILVLPACSSGRSLTSRVDDAARKVTSAAYIIWHAWLSCRESQVPHAYRAISGNISGCPTSSRMSSSFVLVKNVEEVQATHLLTLLNLSIVFENLPS